MRVIVSSAASTASRAATLSGPAAETWTSVPIAGRMRENSAQDGLAEIEQALDAIGNVAHGQGGAADVADIGAHLKRAVSRLAYELVAPFQFTDLVTVRLKILDDLELPHAAVCINAQCVSDQFMFSDDLVYEEPAHHFSLGHHLPDILLRRATGHAGKSLDLLHLLKGELHRLGHEFIGEREDQRARLFDAHVLGGDALRRQGNQRDRRKPADVQTHAWHSRTNAAVLPAHPMARARFLLSSDARLKLTTSNIRQV